MTEDLETFVGDPPRTRWHRAWVVAAVTLGALVAAAAFRSSTGVLLEPIEEEFGWSRAMTSGAVSLNLVLYGLTAPFAAAVMERWGVRRTVAAALVVVGVASGLTTVMTEPWQLWLLWGVLHRRRHRGDGPRARGDRREPLVPHAPRPRHGYLLGRQRHRASCSSSRSSRAPRRMPGGAPPRGSSGVLSLVMAVLVLAFLRDRPSDVGVLPYGLPAGDGRASAGRGPRPHRPSLARPGAPDGQPPLGLLGARADLLGVRLVDERHHPDPLRARGARPRDAEHHRRGAARRRRGSSTSPARWRRAGSPTGSTRACCSSRYYAGRGASLLALDAVLAPGIEPGMWVFIVFYGLDWVATVPPTVALCRMHFGIEDSGRRLRLGLRVAHGRRRGGGERGRLGAHEPGRLPLGLARGRRPVLRGGGAGPVDPAPASRRTEPVFSRPA